MSEFNIRRGKSTVLFDASGAVNDNVVLEDGYWYLCTDTAELFLCVNDNGTLTLKKVNEISDSEPSITIPTNLSEFVNDCGFITKIPENYVVKEDITNLVSKADIENLASKTYVSESVASINIPSNVSDLANDAGYITNVPDTFATKEFVASEIAKAELDGQEVDLSSYYTKSEITDIITTATDKKADKSELFSKDYNDLLNTPNIPSIDGLASEQFVINAINGLDIPDVTNFITIEDVEAKGYINEIPEYYVTETELSNKKYLTEHQSLDHLAEKGHTHTDYANKDHVHEQYITTETLADYARKSDIPSDYITEDLLDTKGYLIAQDIIDKADKDHSHAEYLTEQDLTGYATEAYVREAISDLDVKDIDTSTFVTSEAFTLAITSKADEKPFSTDKFVTTPVGGFVVGESLKDLSIAEILAKLLGLTSGSDEPDEPDIPDEPESIVESIMKNETALYQINDNDVIVEVPYELLTYSADTALTTKDGKTGFYVVENTNGDVVEAGYQHFSTLKEPYYIVALPDSLDLSASGNVEMQSWNTLVTPNKWQAVSKLTLTDDYDEIVATYNEDGIEPPVAPAGYKLWADLSTNDPGSSYRFVIKE